MWRLIRLNGQSEAVGTVRDRQNPRSNAGRHGALQRCHGTWPPTQLPIGYCSILLAAAHFTPDLRSHSASHYNDYTYLRMLHPKYQKDWTESIAILSRSHVAQPLDQVMFKRSPSCPVLDVNHLSNSVAKSDPLKRLDQIRSERMDNVCLNARLRSREATITHLKREIVQISSEAAESASRARYLVEEIEKIKQQQALNRKIGCLAMDDRCILRKAQANPKFEHGHRRSQVSLAASYPDSEHAYQLVSGYLLNESLIDQDAALTQEWNWARKFGFHPPVSNESHPYFAKHLEEAIKRSAELQRENFIHSQKVVEAMGNPTKSSPPLDPKRSNYERIMLVSTRI